MLNFNFGENNNNIELGGGDMLGNWDGSGRLHNLGEEVAEFSNLFADPPQSVVDALEGLKLLPGNPVFPDPSMPEKKRKITPNFAIR